VVQPKHPANISTYLFNTTGLHEGWEKNMQLEYENECRFAPSHNFISKQAISVKQPASIQVVRNCANATHVEQPKYQHLLVEYYGFASRLEESHAVRIWELMQVRSISLPYFKQPIATKQPDSIQTETMQPMCCNPNISTYLFNTIGLHKGWEQNMQVRTIFYFEAGNYNQTTYQQTKCDNATQVVQPKHRRVFVQYHWFTWGLG